MSRKGNTRDMALNDDKHKNTAFHNQVEQLKKNLIN